MHRKEIKNQGNERTDLNRDDSRRSFIKKSCATAVAISATDLLVSAANETFGNGMEIAFECKSSPLLVEN